ncbi:hypothetical protein NF212_07960 [Parasalinivibrio latis]|uniref:hypothetical protein n=1 Tax=Parasalinivibrio latis TaxID=2952610 RepID=UPI0030DF2906
MQKTAIELAEGACNHLNPFYGGVSNQIFTCTFFNRMWYCLRLYPVLFPPALLAARDMNRKNGK